MRKICPLWLLLFCSAASFAQTNPDVIINKVIDAQGGKEKLLAIKTVQMKGNMEFSGQKIPFNYYAVDKKAQRTEFMFSGLTGYTRSEEHTSELQSLV